MILIFLLASVFLFEAMIGIFLCFGINTTLSETGIRQKVLWYQMEISWHESGIRVDRGIFFRILKASGMRFIIIPTRFSVVKSGNSYTFLCQKLENVRPVQVGNQ